MNARVSVDELLNRSAADVAGLLDEAEGSLAKALTDVLINRCNAAMANYSVEQKALVDHISAIFMHLKAPQDVEAHIQFLSDCCFFYDRIGYSYTGIPRGEAARKLAAQHGLINLERRASNSLAIAYLGFADFETACKHLERSLVLAEAMGDRFLICNALSNTVLLFLEMGLYREALHVADKALAFEIDTVHGRHLQFNNATNGLFCAHRLGDKLAGLRYLSIGSKLLDNPAIDPTSRASFEYYRTLYLLADSDHETAEILVAAARNHFGRLRNPRVAILLDLSDALCDWESGDNTRMVAALERLRDLYQRSKQTRLHHDDVLRTLMQVYGRSTKREDAELGMTYAKELVQYLTSVKRAKFYRQLSDRGVDFNPHQAPKVASTDTLNAAKHWLGLPINARSPDHTWRMPANSIERHDELSAVHDDLAKMRTEALRNSIRTIAYDTAENWALAAEFFDDETGQHCFRVGQLSGMLAEEIGMPEEFCIRIEHAARLHDLGKIGVNELILLKPGPLDPSELIAMRSHAEVGAQLLNGNTDPTLGMAATIARYHHEWWNGTGYPTRFAGMSIPLPARICALADVYDALTHRRPYKVAWSHRTTVEQMLAESGIHFDPDLLSPFLRVLERYVVAQGSERFIENQRKAMQCNPLLASRQSLIDKVNNTR